MARPFFYEHVSSVPSKLKDLGFAGQFHWVPHHRAHAASAFFASPFYKALTLSIDGIGEDNTAGVYLGEGNDLTKIASIDYPNSIGFFWEKFSEFLGFSPYDACKVMGMSANGDGKKVLEPFTKIVTLTDDGLFKINIEIMKFRANDFKSLEELFEINKRQVNEPLQQIHYDIADGLQLMTNNILMHIVSHFLEQTQTDYVCLAGGVGLNCVSNNMIYQNTHIRDLFVQPAAHDGGTALGCALSIWHKEMGNSKRAYLPNTYLGPAYSDENYEAEAKKAGLSVKRIDDIETEVAVLLTQGNIVSWFQDRMEFGPRALGNRSLLADPRNPLIREIMNVKVKHREEFRPFAPSILKENVGDWFKTKGLPNASYYMLMAMDVIPEKAGLIPAVIHSDNTGRVQVVEEQNNPKYYNLIREFGKLTGVPMLLNTSFNDNEPIVCSPADAIKTFLSTRIDFLVLGNYLIASPN